MNTERGFARARPLLPILVLTIGAAALRSIVPEPSSGEEPLVERRLEAATAHVAAHAVPLLPIATANDNDPLPADDLPSTF